MAKHGIFRIGQNLIGQSNDLDPNLWSGRYISGGVTIVSTSEIAPNGKPEALVIQANTPANSSIYQYIGFSPDKFYTISVWAKRFNDIAPSNHNLIWCNISSIGAFIETIPTLDKAEQYWKRFSVTLATSITAVSTSYVALLATPSSPEAAHIGYWGFSVTETDTLYPYVVTSSSVASDSFTDFIELYSTDKTKLKSKQISKIAKTLSGKHFAFGKNSTDSARFEFDDVSSSNASLVNSWWENGISCFVSNAVFPESILGKIMNSRTPITKIDAETSSTMRMILDVERYW